jgi:hypothetical protein
MRRREFITLLGGATAAAWPLAAHAQQAERMRRVGVLMPTSADAEQQQNLAAFQQALQQLGWAERRNLQTEIRWAEGRIVLSAEALAMAASQGHSPVEMARHLLKQHHDRAAGLIQKTGEN